MTPHTARATPPPQPRHISSPLILRQMPCTHVRVRIRSHLVKGAPLERVAVVTGDVIDSRKYVATSRTRLNNALRRGFDFVATALPGVALTTIEFRITAGDEFQFVLKAPQRSLESLFLLRSFLAHEAFKPPVRFRAAVGIGQAKYRPARNANVRPYEWDGPAFVSAREGLDLIKSQRSPERWTTIVTGNAEIDHEFNAILGLVDHLQRSWTTSQWEAIGWTMRGLKRHETARRLKVAHQNVSKRLSAAGWPAVAAATEYVQYRLSPHP